MSTLTFFGGDITDGSEATPGLWDRRFSTISQNLDEVNAAVAVSGSSNFTQGIQVGAASEFTGAVTFNDTVSMGGLTADGGAATAITADVTSGAINLQLQEGGVDQWHVISNSGILYLVETGVGTQLQFAAGGTADFQSNAVSMGALTASTVSTTGSIAASVFTASDGTIFLGTDASLYRSVANTLRTEDNLQVAATLTVTGTSDLGLIWGSSNMSLVGAVEAEDIRLSSGSVRINAVPYTWPAADGVNNQVLTTDGSGALSWSGKTSGAFVSDVTGVATAPAFTFEDDADSGIYMIEVDRVGIAAGGVAICDFQEASAGAIRRIAAVSKGNHDDPVFTTEDGSAGNDPTGTGIYFATQTGDSALHIAASSETCAAFPDTAASGNVRLMVWDVDNATLEQVSVGAADTGGSGFKVLRIPN